MQAHTPQPQRVRLRHIAEGAMLERGLLPNFSAAAIAELQALTAAAGDANDASQAIRDLTTLGWASIDNDDSRDLDQLTVAEALPGDATRIRVAVADVDALVKAGSAIDQHARHNTTSVYTAAEIFPMLPEQLSTDLTSLNAGEDRLAIVVDMVIGTDGTVQNSEIYRARVHNQAKLAYNSLAAWLDGQGPAHRGGQQEAGHEQHQRPSRSGHVLMAGPFGEARQWTADQREAAKGQQSQPERDRIAEDNARDSSSAVTPQRE